MGAPRHIVGVLLAQNAKPTVIGIVVGVVLAAVVSRPVHESRWYNHPEDQPLIAVR